MHYLSREDTIKKIEQMIDEGNGDAGRLYHIMETIKNKKELYRSDQKYLENKLELEIDVKYEEIEKPKEPSKQIKDLIDRGIGDPGRLQHIMDMINNGKKLYSSDIKYIESKIGEKFELDESEKDELGTRDEVETIKEIQKGTMPKGWRSEENHESKKIKNQIKKE